VLVRRMERAIRGLLLLLPATMAAPRVPPAYDYRDHADTRIIDWGDGGRADQPAGRGVMTLEMMTDKGLGAMGAVCLDGSDAGFYFSEATNATYKVRADRPQPPACAAAARGEGCRGGIG
jgi:hypothetical protein